MPYQGTGQRVRLAGYGESAAGREFQRDRISGVMEAPGSSLRAQRRRNTMAIDKSYSGMLGNLGRLTTALAANAADLPHLEGIRTRLEKLLTDAQDTAKQQAALTASKQEATLRLRTLLTEGKRLSTSAQKALQQNYGPRAEKL